MTEFALETKTRLGDIERAIDVKRGVDKQQGQPARG